MHGLRVQTFSKTFYFSVKINKTNRLTNALVPVASPSRYYSKNPNTNEKGNQKAKTTSLINILKFFTRLIHHMPINAF